MSLSASDSTISCAGVEVSSGDLVVADADGVTIVPAAAAADGLVAGSDWTYLGVFTENDVARRVYRDVGFEQVGDPCPDLLLVG